MKRILPLLIFFCAMHNFVFAQIPILNSNPTVVHKVLYLDFDGQAVYGTAWNTTYSTPTINALPSTLSPAVMTEIWKRVSEDYRPFDVNVTTDVNKFNAATPTLRMRIVITPSSTWYPSSVGGVAFLNSFSWGGNPDTPCWVFENMLSYSAKNCAEAASHEGGHTLSLKHQSIWNPTTCTKTAEYHNGIGTGVTSWAPIMGVGYSKNVTIWHNGPNSTTCTTLQFDHGGNAITGSLFLNYRNDDVGNTLSNAKILNVNSATVLDTGIISTNTDVDVYKFDLCNSRYMTFDVKPWSLDTVNYSGANLDVRLTLYNAITSNSIAIDTSLTRLNARIGTTLTPGSYYFVIDGGGSANYSDYGSLGQYHIKITSNNVPSIVSNFNTIAPFCAGQPIIFNDASSGTPSAWSWSLTGASPATSTLQNFQATYAAAGIYTVSLSASSGTNVSCGITKTLQVVPVPTVLVASTSTAICAAQTATLSAIGANSYVWSTSSTNTSIVVSPASTTVYSVTGTSNSCAQSKSISIVVNSLPSVSSAGSTSLICDGEAAVLTANGAFTYSWNTGANTQSIAVSPTVTSVYTVTGTDANGCSNTSTVQLIVSWCTGLSEQNNLQTINIYPNPSDGLINIRSSVCENCEMIVYNALGQIVKSLNISSEVGLLDIRNEPKGIYHAVILNKGVKVAEAKIVKD